MSWSIYVDLPENRDNKGSLKLYSPGGSLVFTCEALGRGSNHSLNGYDHTKWWMTNADTPTGEWTGEIAPAASPSSSYGPYERVRMTAITGKGDHADIACNTYGRNGFLIHGGDPETDSSATWYPLNPTYGCIRISNSNQNTLLNLSRLKSRDSWVNPSNEE